MHRADRILLATALLFAFLLAAGRWRDVQARAAATGQAAPSASLDEARARFGSELAAFRGGDAPRLAPLRALARELCERWQRCEALDIVEYYAALAPGARARGVADEARGQALRERVRAAEAAGLVDELWAIERDELLFALEELAHAIPRSGDGVPGAQARALAARLRVEHLRTLADPDDPERAAELAALRDDLEASLEGFARAGMLRPRIELAWIRGVLAREQGEWRTAELELGRCLADARAVGEKTWQRRALEMLHALAETKGDSARAGELVDELALVCAPEQPWGLARRHALGLFASDQPGAAAEFLRTHAPAAAGRERDEHALLEGHALLRAGRRGEAEAAYARIAPDSPVSRFARLSEARALLAGGQARAALARIEANRPAAHARGSELDEWRTLHAEAALAAGQRALAVHELEQSLEENAQAQLELLAADDSGLETANLFGEVLGLHAVELLARAHLEGGDALEAAVVIESAQASALRLADGSDAPRWRVPRGDLLAWARRFELGLVTWVVGADETLVASVAADGTARGARIAHGRRELQEGVRRLREALLAGDEPRRLRLARELCQALFPPAILDPLLARTGTADARVCLFLHGPLEALPVEAFEDGAWLVEGIVPVVLPGMLAAAAEPARQSAGAPEWCLLGDPRGAEGEVVLPGARAELEELARLRPDAQRATGAAFDRGALFRALRSGASLHLATHARLRPDRSASRFEASCLELARGELYSLEEIREARPRSPLVVLSACETGGGRYLDAEGLQGLARAFLESGTRNLVVTSWPVEDRWARAFALALHKGLLRGLPPGSAAAEARRSLRAQGAPASEWAAFRALGEG